MKKPNMTREQWEATTPPVNESWIKDFDERFGYILSKPMSINIKYMIDSLLSTARQEATREAYAVFLKTIRDAKKRFPGSKEFIIEVDVRDLEKSIEYLTSKGK